MHLSKISLALRQWGAGAWSPSSLFAAGEQGAWYDPSDLTTMFQDRAGATPVTADGQPVGLILDKSKGLVLGAERVISPYSVTGVGWSSTATSVSRSLNGSSSTGVVSTNIPTGGKSYKVTFDISGISGDTCYVTYGDDIGSPASKRLATNGSYSFVLTTTNDGGLRYVPYEGGDFALTVTNISVKELPGNHATAPSDSARPLYKTDGTYHWLQFDGVDDGLSTAAINFTTTDKMSIFAGVRRVGNGSIVETGVNRTSVGAFGLRAVTSELDLGFNINGFAYKTTTALPDAPQTEVIYAKLDAALTGYSGVGPMRVNAASAALGAGAGAGNSIAGYFGNNVARVGSYDGGGYITGNIYSLIVLGRTAITQEITDTETWVNGKTGAY